MGITKGKWSTLVTELMAFKELYDRNAPLSQALPTLAADYPNAYAAGACVTCATRCMRSTRNLPWPR